MRKKAFPRVRNRFRMEKIVSARKKSFPRGRNRFCEAEIMVVIYGYISKDRYSTSDPLNPEIIRRHGMSSSCRKISLGGNSFPRKYFSLVEIVLPCGYISSSRKKISSSRKYFFLAEMISFSLKLFLPRGNDLWRTYVPSGLPYTLPSHR